MRGVGLRYPPVPVRVHCRVRGVGVRSVRVCGVHVPRVFCIIKIQDNRPPVELLG